MLAHPSLRRYLIYWLYAVAIIHLLVGIGLSLFSDISLFDSYHQVIEFSFWGAEVPAIARAQQVWWMSLFGATLQYVGLIIWLLVYVGHRYRHPELWLGGMIAFMIWVPQDIYFSLKIPMYFHVLVDIVAWLAMVPALAILFYIDYRFK